MKPTIGRIVVYNTTEEQRKVMAENNRQGVANVQSQLPAIIVAVWSDTCVNLKVIQDGYQLDNWIKSANQGDNEGNWDWPVIQK